jgi:hypothetical protein
MRVIKLATAYTLTVFMTDTDHITGKTGLTLTITASKAGAAFGSITPTVTELVNGWYALALTASHTDTLGDLAFHITASGADPTDLVLQVRANVLGDTLPASLADKTGFALTAAYDPAKTAAQAADLATVAGYIDTEVAAIKAKTDNLPSDPADQSVLEAALAALPLAPSAAAIRAEIDSASTQLAAIKAKTDNLPTDPADQSLLIAAIAAIPAPPAVPSGASLVQA